MNETQTSGLPARPKPRPAYRSAAPAEDRDPVTETDEDGHDEVVRSAIHVTPQSRPRPMATYSGTKSPIKSHNENSQLNGATTSQTPRKRGRDVDAGEQSATDGEGSLGDIQVRRKRVRH
jgi:hypothetical protein